VSTDLQELQNRLWGVADELRANSGLKASEYASPVLGLIFLRYANDRFDSITEQIGSGSDRYTPGPEAYIAKGAIYVPDEARFETLVNLPEGADLGKSINDAMKAIEKDNPSLDGVLPRNYTAVSNDVLVELLRALWALPESLEGDGFGLIYEYFLGKFAMSEGQKGGEFFTPTSVVKLIVEILEPFEGRILDPACGSGGMFVQSAHFVERNQSKPSEELSVYGQEKTGDTVRLAKMNLAVHGLEGDIRETNTYYENPFDSVGMFDYVMANPPFNVKKVDKAKLEDDPRYPLGIPSTDNGNYLWIQLFYSALNESGQAGFVMANSASDAGSSELAIRQQLIESGAVDTIIAVGTNMFYTVTLPVTLWFLNKGSENDKEWKDKTLFIDAREIYNTIDRAHRDWTPDQIEFLANIYRTAGGNKPVFSTHESETMFNGHFPHGGYEDVLGLCKIASNDDIEKQGWSLNPGRYVGVKIETLDEGVFKEKMLELSEEFNELSDQAEKLTSTVRNILRNING
jgi:type I restriction enzyme M protein